VSIRVDQGTEFVSRDLDLWAYHRGVTLDFCRPGKPTDNAFIEAFNSRLKLREDRRQATRPNETWAMDFVHDQLATGTKLRVLTREGVDDRFFWLTCQPSRRSKT
jgi:transposase InsO family protein